MTATRTELLRDVPGPGERVLQGVPRRFRLLPFLGPAFVACVAYIDPGNFATNIAGGSKFGFTLVWVIVAANVMAMLIQTLSAKLGIATGRNLPEVCRERFSRRTSIGLWLQAEAIAMATDLAEFLGAALGVDSEQDRSAERRRSPAPLPLHEDRRADRDDACGSDQRRHAGGRRDGVLRQRSSQRVVARESAPNPRADPRQCLERAVRARADRVWAVELDGGHARRPGRDAGIHPPQDPDLGPAYGDNAAGVDRHRNRRGSIAHARAQPGCALIRNPVRF